MEMLIFVVAALVLVVICLWEQTEPQKQRRLWHEFYAEDDIYEMEPFDYEHRKTICPDIYYWDNKRKFSKIQERLKIRYNGIQKIMAVYDTSLEAERGWKVYFLMKNGRITKGYMLSKDLTPKRLE